MKWEEFSKKNFENKSGVYKLSIGGRIYIGSSKNLGDRLSEHRTDLQYNRHANSFLQRAFNKYGKEQTTIEIVEYCDPDVRFDREKFWIKELNAEFNLSDPVTLQPLTPEQLKKFQESATEARKIRVNNLINSTKIECYDYLGEYIKEYSSIKEAAKELEVKPYVIQHACGGYKKGVCVKGKRFRYANSKVPIQKFELNPNQIGRRIDFYYKDENGEEKLAFTSIKNVFKFFADQISKNPGQPITIIPKPKKCCEEWNGLIEVNHIPSSTESVEKDQRLDKVALPSGVEGEISMSAAL